MSESNVQVLSEPSHQPAQEQEQQASESQAVVQEQAQAAAEQAAEQEAKAQAFADAVPYGHYRECLCQLVERREKDKPAEHWILLPGLEQEARDLFAKAAAEPSWFRAVLSSSC